MALLDDPLICYTYAAVRVNALHLVTDKATVQLDDHAPGILSRFSRAT